VLGQLKDLPHCMKLGVVTTVSEVVVLASRQRYNSLMTRTPDVDMTGRKVKPIIGS
jgi:hypothetical protein